jgi:hypothetical protein
MRNLEQEKILTYLSLMQVLYELSDEIDSTKCIFSVKVVKERVRALTYSLNKEIAKVFQGKVDEEWDRAANQHNEGADLMREFYRIGMQVAKLDSIKAQGFDTQLTILLKNYGIE